MKVLKTSFFDAEPYYEDGEKFVLENGETKLTLTNTYSYTVKLPGIIDLTYNGNKDGVSLYDIDKC
ncbi:hypothetical protein SAMN04487830_10520 [Pseudobutyrivibrio sp. OR37]|uniref:hypothetical protein n=1 Tax=Pseudobutyrivibrio sp. OR37 TaxID=1798186 RepID=UPI0008E6CBDD|nr:hypothetical protein [Pseudobutyrivibrio sp. OR37]SFH68380.1 hypothetical protein SAMN04487830_10520 [Pseudobutyrivibrio sp. OR37]